MRRLYRSTTDRKIAGVCGGMGILLDWDPNQIRLLLALVAILTGILPACICYIIAWAILPEDTAI